jgi:hypothetical protein
MRRERKQTGSTRAAKPTKMDSVNPAVAATQGPLPWDRHLQEIRKPSNR